MTEKTLVFWDIDGTLLNTARAGIGALEDAVGVVLHANVCLADMHTAGMTDPQIADHLVQRVYGRSDDRLSRELLTEYTRALPHRLLDRQGGVCEGVKDALDALITREDVVLALLTGNMRAGAVAKLECYGLAGYFTTGGFGDDARERRLIGAAACHRLDREHLGTTWRRRFLVGDTPSDIACGDCNELLTVAVASGLYGLAELERQHPWVALARIPPPDDFMKLLSLSDG